jgi:phosphatidate cytidylyltransferase
LAARKESRKTKQAFSQSMNAQAPVNTPPPMPKGKVFLRRLASFIVLWTVVLAALFSGNKIVSDYVFLLIIVLLAGAGMVEFYGIVGRLGVTCFSQWGMVCGVLLIVATFLFVSGQLGPATSPAHVNDFESSFIILFVLGLCIRQFVSRTNTAGILAISTTLFGLMYVPWLLNFIQKINFFFPDASAGHFYVLYFVLVTKFSDCGAYAIGSLVGKHKMIPRISPGKTWEGFAGAVVISTAASAVFADLAGEHLPGMNFKHAVILGVILSMAAVVGDLIESLFKREAGLKDSGRLFPGIGGILDLLDSLLFNAPLMYLYLRYVLVK